MVTQQATIEKKKLLITAVSPLSKVGDKQIDKLSFRAEDELGREHPYFTFSGKLFETIQKGIGQTIEFDVETTSNGEYINRKVTQAYTGGQPIAVKKGFSGRTSPEERASIETQVAVKLAVELRIADIITDKHPAYVAAMEWIKSKLVL